MDAQALIAQAMLASLDAEARDALITKAISHIMSPQVGSYGAKNPSPFEEAFTTAVRSMATKLVDEYVANIPSVRERLMAAVTEAFEKFFTGEKLAQVMTERMYSLFEASR